MNVVATVPSFDTFTLDAPRVDIAPGTLFAVGIPFSTVLISTVTGILSSLDKKNRSIEVTNIPPGVVTLNVWASGSPPPPPPPAGAGGGGSGINLVLESCIADDVTSGTSIEVIVDVHQVEYLANSKY